MGKPKASLVVSSVLRLPGHEVGHFCPGVQWWLTGDRYPIKGRAKSRNDLEKSEGTTGGGWLWQDNHGHCFWSLMSLLPCWGQWGPCWSFLKYRWMFSKVRQGLWWESDPHGPFVFGSYEIEIWVEDKWWKNMWKSLLLPQRSKISFWRNLSLERALKVTEQFLQSNQGHIVIKDATVGLKSVIPWEEKESESL